MVELTDECIGEDEVIVAFRRAAAADLRFLAWLHDREPDAGRLSDLRASGFPETLGLPLRNTAGQEASRLMAQAIGEISDGDEEDVIDELAVDYADIYLTYKFRSAPTESVWLDKENLERQEPMFRIRQWYRKHDLAVGDWRRRSDDHFVVQLQFVAYLLEYADGDAGLEEAADFLDAHLLRWIGGFAGRVAGRCQTRFFAGLALITAAYVEQLRDILAEYLDHPRPEPEAAKDDRPVTADEPDATAAMAPVSFGPGW